MFNMFLGKTASEEKRDEYYMLYELLGMRLSDHDKHVAKANAAYHSYLSTVPDLSNSMIPSNDFDPKREELNGKLNGYFNSDRDMRASIAAAKNKAHERYVHYKNAAVQEAAAKAAAEKAAAEAAKQKAKSK